MTDREKVMQILRGTPEDNSCDGWMCDECPVCDGCGGDNENAYNESRKWLSANPIQSESDITPEYVAEAVETLTDVILLLKDMANNMEGMDD